jgi:hypothetical protein
MRLERIIDLAPISDMSGRWPIFGQTSDLIGSRSGGNLDRPIWFGRFSISQSLKEES